MSFVEKHNPLKGSMLSKKRDGIYRDLDHILGVFLAEYTPYNLRHYKELRTEGGEL